MARSGDILTFWAIRAWPRALLAAALVAMGWALGMGLYSLWLLLVPLGLDIVASRHTARLYACCKADLLELLETQAASEAELAPGDARFVSVDYQGLFKHWLLAPRPARMALTLAAPRQSSLVIVRRAGTIFPPLRTAPPAFQTRTENYQEVYYNDIDSIDIRGDSIVMNTTGGRTIEYQDRSGRGAEAVQLVRNRLRRFKS